MARIPVGVSAIFTYVSFKGVLVCELIFLARAFAHC
jgi:hypothetical protein